MKDLVVLTACKDGEYALRGLLGRPEALRIRRIDCVFFNHPKKDPGCANSADLILRSQAGNYSYALVVFDHEGSGKEAAPASSVAQDVEAQLNRAGWGNRARALVIEPELEQWVWSDSAVVDDVLGWQGRQPDLRSWLRAQGFLQEGSFKARPPKDAMLATLRETGTPVSSSNFEQLAKRVSVNRYTEPSFLRLLEILRGWFPVREA